MNQTDIWKASQADLQKRLPLASKQEADMIRRELARRVGCAS